MQFADKERARQVVKEKYPDAVHTVFIEHGYDNLVALVDETYVLRFPRNEHAYERDRYEKEVLGQLTSLQGVKIPESKLIPTAKFTILLPDHSWSKKPEE